ncbi:MAG: ATPase domain-containing protein, partial [Actinomycetota bacterium]|nr:ATPase domain-containing protein [Actinomycetota bacterium]
MTDKTKFVCGSCDAVATKWSGRCGRCCEWNTLTEAAPSGASRRRVSARRIGDVDRGAVSMTATGLDELDRVLGGGLVPGSVTLLGGEPGIGKSTLTLQIAAGQARRKQRVLLVGAEESSAQVRLRAERL